MASSRTKRRRSNKWTEKMRVEQRVGLGVGGQNVKMFKE